MFEQRHFVAIAETLGEYIQNAPVEENANDDLINRFVKLFKKSNPRFDTGRFIGAVAKTGAPHDQM
jgi:uncharacterized protein YggU (UPF0235/DUF167 family)